MPPAGERAELAVGHFVAGEDAPREHGGVDDRERRPGHVERRARVAQEAHVERCVVGHEHAATGESSGVSIRNVGDDWAHVLRSDFVYGKYRKQTRDVIACGMHGFPPYDRMGRVTLWKNRRAHK